MCSAEDCPKERSRLDAELSRFCHAHRCGTTTCREAKGSGPYCRTHTCEHDDCFSYVTGNFNGHMGQGQRLCERHRRCRIPGCARGCHIREGGIIAPFYGAHYCDVEGCEQERSLDSGGRYCLEHRCVERDCRKRRDGRQFCKEHRGRSRHCQQGQMGTSMYCAYHGCVFEGCGGEAGPGGYCMAHQRCLEPGSGGRRFMGNGVEYPTCEGRMSRIILLCLG